MSLDVVYLALLFLITLKDVSRINFISHIIKTAVIAVGDDGVTLFLESIEVVDNLRAKECLAILQGGLVDDDVGALSLDTLHDALDSTLAEVIGVALHRQTEHANGDFLLGALAPRSSTT